jgi:hypothetical protein
VVTALGLLDGSTPLNLTGYSSAWSEHRVWDAGAGGSNPSNPTSVNCICNGYASMLYYGGTIMSAGVLALILVIILIIILF